MRCLRYQAANSLRHSLLIVKRRSPPQSPVNGVTRRGIIDVVSPLLLPPLVFSGLVVTLWTWKCMMMILFQNKIIYMPGLPPNTRRERISDYANQCAGITWREERTRSSDGVQIGMCVAEAEGAASLPQSHISQPVYVLYFQGNASSLPPRLPFLSQVLKKLKDDPTPSPIRYIMVCASYRGFWTSQGRPSEAGIAKDALAALRWISSHSMTQVGLSGQRVPVILWGQSIGAGVATTLAANRDVSPNIDIRKLILETPFTSVRDMLLAIYPEKWLPYRYLWPFLWNRLDSYAALGAISHGKERATLPEVVILEAGNDELVPKAHGITLEKRGLELGFQVRRHVIGGALHTEAMVRPLGRSLAAEAIRSSATIIVPS